MAKKVRAGGDFLSKIPWADLFALVEKLLANCQTTGVPPAQQEKQLRNPNPRIRAKVERRTERGFLRNGGTRSQWRKNKDSIMETVYERAKNASKEDVKRMRARAALYIEVPGDEDDEE